MVLRAVALVGGLSLAVAFSQFPEYSQQYTQRLAGAVDELSRVVERIDADASELNLTRQIALSEMAKAGGMAEARAESMQRVFHRHEKLFNDLRALRGKASVEKVTYFWRMTDPDVARKAWHDFRPAMPVTMEGIGFGLAGFLAGAGLIGGLRILLSALPRRRRATV